MDTIKANGAAIPVIGFGTWQLRGRQAEKMVKFALQLGYRHVDTAQMYGNERDVGRGIAAADVPREELFLGTKLLRENLAPRRVLSSFDQSLSKLGTDYVDLLLIHWPNRSIPLSETLGAMNELRQEGKVRHLGVSNFSVDLLDEALSVSQAPLVTNQVEYHPFLDQSQVLQRVQQAEMALTAYSPLAKGRAVNNETLVRIGERYGKSAAQVSLRWLIQQDGVVTIPKSSSEEHCRQNIDVFDFELTQEEMRQIHDLAQPEGRIVNPGFVNFD